VLERTLALAHPIMPFVTEEVWSFLPAREAELIVSAFPCADRARYDAEAEAEIDAAIELTRALRRWRELADVAPGAILSGRAAGEGASHELVGRLARFELTADADGDGDAVATVGPVEVLASAELDGERVAARIEERRSTLRSEVDRAERKLANDGFVAKAPADVVDAERAKLERYRAELEELSG
jgi:valyl-tRNA synthetase